ncbi:DUF4179 domain-containing protein [Paenibacillus sp. FA6]|uniref:DUF4179 domain-containing protein n=1 Tax=Paenibacillus sp. FA6 TaxID=3413029 RepID=UPI003F65E909
MHNPTEQEMDDKLVDRIEVAITEGIRQGQTKMAYRKKQRRRRFAGAIAASILLFSCLFTIKVSPVFAAIVGDIPGLQKFVDMINNTSDKGIKLALDHDFIQPVGVSDEHEGMKFTVQGIIADDSRMIVFYDIQLPENDYPVRLDRFSLTDISGEKLQASISYNDSREADQDFQEAGIQRGTAEFELPQGVSLPSEVVLKVLLTNLESTNTSNVTKDMIVGNEEIPVTGLGDVGGTEFNVNIPIDQEKFAALRHEYILGETIQIEGQKVTFSKAVVSPLRVSLYMDYDDHNSKQIFGPGDIQLVDDEGTVWRNISGSMGVGRNHPVYHFESPYFKEPKWLTIEGSWFRALDRNQMSVIVDTEKGEILQAPDEKLNLYKMTNLEKALKLDFSLSILDPEDNMMYNLFDSEFTDANGKRYPTADLEEIISGYFEGRSMREQHSLYYIEKDSYAQPLTLTVYDYPAYIREAYKIRIK